jgi:hypothetical protein
VLAVERATGVPRDKLRPDLYRKSERRQPVNTAAIELLRKWRREVAKNPVDPNLERDLAELRANRIRFRTFD